jgi:hypothetical protein
MDSDIIQTVHSKADSYDANTVCVEDIIPTKSMGMFDVFLI